MSTKICHTCGYYDSRKHDDYLDICRLLKVFKNNKSHCDSWKSVEEVKIESGIESRVADKAW